MSSEQNRKVSTRHDGQIQQVSSRMKVEGGQPNVAKEEGRRQRDITSSETGNEEDVESPLFDQIPRDPRILLPQLSNE